MILIGTLLAVAIILLGTHIVARRARRLDATAKASVAGLIRTNGILVAVVVLGAGVQYFQQQRWEYRRCLDRVESRESYRADKLGTFDTFDAATQTKFYTSELRAVTIEGRDEKLSLREALEVQFPPLERSECQSP